MPDDWAEILRPIWERILVLAHYFRVYKEPGSTTAANRSAPDAAPVSPSPEPEPDAALVPVAAPAPTGPEQRRLPRKAVLLNGVLTDLEGEQALDCAIHDINARGAAVSASRELPFEGQVYLLDSGNRAAHLARIVWSKGNRAGLLFVQSHTMGPGLPPKMRFLWRHLLEAKLRQADRAVAMGVPAELALGTVGLTREHVHQMARYAPADERFHGLLQRVEALLEYAE